MDLRLRRGMLLQLIRFGIVGVINTLLTLTVIFVCKSLLGVNIYVANALGYGVGLLNSFVWNKRWVFKSDGRYRREAVKFLVGFAVCYLAQFAVVYVLSSSNFVTVEVSVLGFVISGYGIATLIGNVMYTLCNFIYNRLVTFR